MILKIIWLLLMVASWIAVYRAGKSAGASEENKRCSILVREMKEVVDQMAADTSLIINSAIAAMRIAGGNKDALEHPACSGSTTRGGYAEDQQHCCAQPGEEHPCADCPVRGQL